MAKSDALEQAASRLTAAVDHLEDCVAQVFDDSEVGALREQIRLLREERARLEKELDAERRRSRILESANDEVSGRLENAMAMLRGMIPLSSG